MRPFFGALLFIICGGLASCEYGSPPAVANAFPQPATFKVVFTQGAPFEVTLSQGAILSQPEKGHRLISVTVSEASGARHDYSAAVLQRVREQRHVPDELWIFSPRGIRLEDVHDTGRIRKELPTPPEA